MIAWRRMIQYATQKNRPPIAFTPYEVQAVDMVIWGMIMAGSTNGRLPKVAEAVPWQRTQLWQTPGFQRSVHV